jgi:nucleoside-diphosphate-sugar epimerase
MTVLVIGSGVVGSQAARIEVERGERPVVLEVAPQPEALSQIVDLGSVKLVQGDILNPLDLARVIREEGVTRIIHTAANPLLTVGAQDNPYPAINLNIMGTVNVLEAARIFGIERVSFCSSAVLNFSMAGGEDGGEALKEEAYPRPTTFYGTTKQTCENLGFNYAERFGVDFRAVRFAVVFGPWGGRGGGGGITQRYREVVERGLRGEEVTVPDSAGRVEHVYSKDAAQGVVLACHTEGLTSRVFNIGMGRVYTAEEVGAIIQDVIPQVRERVAPPREPTSPQARQGPMDTTRSSRELGYTPQFDMRGALEDYVQFAQS